MLGELSSAEWDRVLCNTFTITGAAFLTQVAAIDADEHKDAASEYGVNGFPTIKLISKKSNGKLRSVDYKARGLSPCVIKLPPGCQLLACLRPVSAEVQFTGFTVGCTRHDFQSIASADVACRA